MRHMTLGYLTLLATPQETIDAAAAARFRSVGVRITGRRIFDPYAPVIGNRPAIAQMKRRLREEDIRLSNVTAYHLFPDVRYEHMQAVVDTTAELGAPVLLAHSYVARNPEIIELFARYCEYAARAGIRVALEFMRYSQIKSLPEATAWLDAAAQPNAGYVLDPLHLDRCGHSAADVTALDPGRIVFAQLCDAAPRSPDASEEQLMVEARTGRLSPGDGTLPLYTFLDALPPDVELEYEVPIPEHQSLPVADRARIARERFGTFMREYAELHDKKESST
jgi:sugar phosphate isomerase/epimerase